MRLSKKSKAFITIVAASSLILPVSTLTACSNISQYCIPIITSNSPYTVEVKDPYRENGNGCYNTKLGDSYDIQDDTLQVPSQYLYTSKYNGSFQQEMKGSYGYTNYNTPTWSKDGPEGSTGKENEFMFSRQTDNNYSWISTSDSKINYVSNNSLSSYQNLGINSAISSVNSVSNTFILNFNYMNMYLDKVIGQKNPDDVLKCLSYLFSGQATSVADGFTYGGTTAEEQDLAKRDFFAYHLSNANLISTDKTKYKFGPYNINWDFVEDTGLGHFLPIESGYSDFGDTKSPFPELTMKSLNKYEYGWFETPEGKTNTPSNLDQPFKFPTNNEFTGRYVVKDYSDPKNIKYTYNPTTSDPSTAKSQPTVGNPYIAYSFKDENDKKVISDFSGIRSIPMLIRPTKIQSAYYDPSDDRDTIQPTDWLTPTSNINKVNNKIKDEGAWSEVAKHENLPNLQLNTLTYNQIPVEHTNNPVGSQYEPWMSDAFKAEYTKHTGGQACAIDPRVLDWIDNGKIDIGDWVVLANYGTWVINFQYKYTEDNGDEKTQYIKAILPYFSGYSAVFPAYMLFTNTNCYKKVNDVDKDNLPDEIKYLADQYYVDYSKTGIEDDVNNMLKALTDDKMPNTSKTYSSCADMLKNDPYMIYYWTFGQLGTKTGAEQFDFLNNYGKTDYSEVLQTAAL